MGKPTRQEALAAIRTLISYIGDDPDRRGLRETPERFISAWEEEWGVGYQARSGPLVKLFPEDSRSGELSSQFNEMILLRDIQFWSHCEHHLAPFFGTVDIGYLPTVNGIVGLSKLARVTDHFSRRLQVQERLVSDVANYLAQTVSPNVGVIMRATHLCMCSRGVRQQHTQTVTSALRGSIFSEEKARSEFLSLTKR